MLFYICQYPNKVIMQVSKTLLNDVKKGLGQLVEQNIQLQADRLKLENHIAGLQTQLTEAQDEFGELHELNGQLKMAKAVSGPGEDTGEAKAKINEMVREIDKCLALLNT